MKSKKEINILIGIAFINLINGTLLTLSPAIFKEVNIGSEWFIGIYITLNTLITYLGSSIVFINKLSLRINYNLITYLSLVLPSLLLFFTVSFENKILLIIYVIVFSCLLTIRAISVSGITMLDKNNVDLVKYKNILATITTIVGLFIGQYILDKSLIYFFIYIFILIAISLYLLIKYRTPVKQKKFSNTKIKSEEFKKLGLFLGIGRGCSLAIIAVLNYLIIINITSYGYLKVIEAIFSILFLIIISNYLKRNAFSLKTLISLRTLILLLPLLLLVIMTKNLNILVLFVASILISLTTIGEDVLLNIIFAKTDNKNINKHLLLYSSYYKICTISLLVSIILLKIFDCQNTIFIVIFTSLIIIIFLMNNHFLKKLNNIGKR